MSMKIENLTNYELAIRQRNDALELNKKYAAIIAAIHREESPGVIAELEAKLAGIAVQAPIQSGELQIATWQERMNKSGRRECESLAIELMEAEIADLRAALASPSAQQQASTAPAPVLRKLSDVMRKDPMSPEDFGLNGEHANKARAYHTAMMAEAAQEQAAVVPAGWKLVPVKPTEDMVDATNLKIGGCYSCAASIPSWEECAEIYADMLAAAPAPPVAQAHALTDAEIDAMARKANLDGSMLIGHRSDYWRAFARDLIAHLARKG